MAENSLRRLRRAAGFSSAKAFAESIGIPVPSYARYEQAEDGPDTSMPIKNAWIIADALGCSIDALVGREHLSPDAVRGDVQAFYNALTSETKELFDDFMEFAAMREEKARRRAQRKEEAEYREIAEGYIRELYSLAATDGRFASRVLFGSAEDARDAFEQFVLEREGVRITDQLLEMFGNQIASDGVMEIDMDGEPEYVDDDEPDFQRHYQVAVALLQQQLPVEALEQKRKEVDKIMQAYDAIRAGNEVVCRELGDDIVTAPEN